MLWILLAFGLWCVIIGLLVRWELNKQPKWQLIFDYAKFDAAITKFIVTMNAMNIVAINANITLKEFGNKLQEEISNVS